MKFCTKCGKEINENAVICLNCGCAQENVKPKENDSKSFGWGVLGFFFPIVGLILWLIWRDDMPLRSRSVGLGALIGAISTVVFYIVYFFVFFLLFGMGLTAAIVGM